MKFRIIIIIIIIIIITIRSNVQEADFELDRFRFNNFFTYFLIYYDLTAYWIVFLFFLYLLLEYNLL